MAGGSGILLPMKEGRSQAILSYQQRCFREYAASVNLPASYTYPDGNPIRPLPPLQTATGGIMIVGAYPSARFESRPSCDGSGRRRLIPVADNLHPFAKEEYFDGTRVRRLESGEGIRTYLLNEIDTKAEDCWITDLVKVFLYKPDHVDSCGAVMPSFAVQELRSKFMELGRKSLRWIEEECAICKPKLVITLGEEVAQVVSGEQNANADDLLNRPISEPKSVGGYPTLFVPHPDACRRSEKWRTNMKARTALIQELCADGSLV